MQLPKLPVHVVGLSGGKDSVAMALWLRNNEPWHEYQYICNATGNELPEMYAEGERLEREMGHTFRSPGRDKWPAALSELRAEFDSGRAIRGGWKDDEVCRVCSF